MVAIFESVRVLWLRQGKEGEKSVKWQAEEKGREGQSDHNTSIYHRAHGT
jgi:hypothetical protein